jgi:hypothetical protein
MNYSLFSPPTQRHIRYLIHRAGLLHLSILSNYTAH